MKKTKETKEQKDQKELEELRKKADEYLRGWQRAQADMSNLRKQVEREQMEFVKFANSALICEIIPVLDNFNRALSNAAKSIEATKIAKDWLKGMEAIKNQLEEVLKKHGVTKIDCLGKPFNPIEHEALLSEESTDHPENTVIAELETGYKLNNKVIKPSKVKVSKNPQKADKGGKND